MTSSSTGSSSTGSSETGSSATDPLDDAGSSRESGDRRSYGRNASRLDPIAPDWLVRILAPKTATVPWRDMIRATLSIVTPLALGLALHLGAVSIFIGMGALTGSFGDRGGVFGSRFVRIMAGVLGGLAGLLVGQFTGGHGVFAVIAIGVLAAVSALISSINATLSFAGLQMLVLVAVSGGVVAQVPVLAIVPAFLVGAGWAILLSFAQSRIDHAEREPRQLVAELIHSIAAMLREPAGPDPAAGAEQRRAISLQVNEAVDLIVSTRARSAGRRSDLRELSATVTAAARLVNTSFGYSRRGGPQPELAGLVDELADAVEHQQRGWRPPRPGIDDDDARLAMLEAIRQVAAAQIDPDDPIPMPGGVREAHRLRRLTTLLFGRTAAIFAARLAITMMVAEIVRQLVPFQKPYWILLTAALVLKPDLGSVFARGLQRTLGTLVGVLIGAAILHFVPPGGWLLLPMIVLTFSIPFAISRNYGLLATFITPMVFLLLDFGTPVQSTLIVSRLADTAIGALIVLVVGYLCWPSTWRPKLGRTIAAGVDALADYVRAAFGDDLTEVGAARRKAYRSMSDIRSALQSTLAEPPPLSTEAAAWWPFIAQLERATDRLSHIQLLYRYGAGSPGPGEVDQLADAVTDLADSLRERRRPKNLPLPKEGLLESTAAEIYGARRIAARGRKPGSGQHSVAAAAGQ